MPELDVGALNKRITIEQATDVVGARGGLSQTWATYWTAWAAITPVSGIERFISQQVAPTAFHNVRIRYKAGITTKMRVKYGTRTFDIRGALNLQEDGNYIVLTCEERLS